MFKKCLIAIIPFILIFSGCELFDNSSSDNTDSFSLLYEDGIPDDLEVEGATYEGMPLYEWGARPGVIDLFIHVATMEYSGTDGGLMLQKEALDKVVAAFADQGIAIHFDVGTTGLYDQDTATYAAEYNLEGLNNQIPYNASIQLSDSDKIFLPEFKAVYPDYASVYTFVDDYSSNNTYFPTERNSIFYYLAFGSSQDYDGSSGPSGISWCPGDELLITLGGSDSLIFDGSDSMTNLIVNWQAATIMHEFGHSLGLRHGGNENQNYKPNYYSIMNYLYQLNGLPEIGNNEGDRYYWQYGFSGYADRTALVNNPYTTTFDIDYSHGYGGNLNEYYLDESLGLRQLGSSYVDWSGESPYDSLISMDINNADDRYNLGKSTLKDYNDWDHLYFYYAYYDRSISRSALDEQRELMVEEPPKFLDQIKENAP